MLHAAGSHYNLGSFAGADGFIQVDMNDTTLYGQRAMEVGVSFLVMLAEKHDVLYQQNTPSNKILLTRFLFEAAAVQSFHFANNQGLFLLWEQMLFKLRVTIMGQESWPDDFKVTLIPDTYIPVPRCNHAVVTPQHVPYTCGYDKQPGPTRPLPTGPASTPGKVQCVCMGELFFHMPYARHEHKFGDGVSTWLQVKLAGCCHDCSGLI